MGTPYLRLACQMTEILFKSAKLCLSHLKLEVCMAIYEYSLGTWCYNDRNCHKIDSTNIADGIK